MFAGLKKFPYIWSINQTKTNIKMRAIKINVENQTVTVIDIENTLDAIYEAIGNECTTFTSPISYANGDTMYCDDESLLRPETIQGAFMYPDWNYPIVSNAIIIGTDDMGNSVDAVSSPRDIEYGNRFIRKDDPNLINYINQFV